MKHRNKEYAGQEFKVRFDADGKLHIENMDGSDPQGWMEMTIYQQLNDRYEDKAYLYFAKGYLGFTGLWKIGVSENYVRREGEIYARVQHSIECSKRRVWRIERFIHKYYRQYRETGEYFRLPDNVVGDMKSSFTHQFQSEDSLLDWVKEIDYRQWAKILTGR